MKNFSIHCLKLTMMIMMVHAMIITTPDKKQQQKHLRYLIRNETMTMLNQSKWKDSNKQVRKISYNLTTCVRHFFCLAEKSLSALGDLKLVQLLESYNEVVNDTSCHLHGGSMIGVQKLLKEIEKCANISGKNM